jgi:PPOX class probable F420-dependent enzyme
MALRRNGRVRPGAITTWVLRDLRDERQWVPPGGQRWTTAAALARDHRHLVRDEEPGLVGIGVEPAFGIGQRALLVLHPEGNVLFDCVPLLDDAGAAAIEALGGLAAICFSPPATSHADAATPAGRCCGYPAPVDVVDARRFLAEHHRGVLVTTRADGLPQGSPVLATVDADGMVVVSTRETARKTAHVRRTGRAALVAFTDAFFGPWVQVEGPVTVVSLPDAMEGLVAYYRSIRGEHPDWEQYRGAMQAERRVLLRLAIERVGPTLQG